METLRLLGRAALSLGLLLVVVWWAFNYGMATFTPEPYWLGVLSPVAAFAAWRVWPKRLV